MRLPTFTLAATCLLGALAAQDDKLPTIKDKTKDFESIDGAFKLYHKDERKLMVGIPGGKLQKPFLLATSFVGGTELAGWQGPDLFVRWERMGNKLLLVEKDTRYRAKSDDPVQDVVQRTYSDRIIEDVDIVAEEGGELLIDGMGLFGGNAGQFTRGMGGGLRSSLAKIDKVKAFPRNVEIALTMPRSGDGRLVTLHYSVLFLPDNGYDPRVADDRVGYFVTAVKDFTKSDDEERFIRYLNRWNLEKLDSSLRLSPPKSPIVFYIEKTVPIKWRRFVRDGILEWNRAFEKIGFTDAVVVRQQTADNEFASLDPEDARYNFFRWITSEVPFAMGPSRVDPRNGQIVDADIIMDDSMVRSFIRDYEEKMKDAPAKLLGTRAGQMFAQLPESAPIRRIQRARALRAGLTSERDDAGAAARAPTIEELARDRAERGACALGEGKLHQVAMGRLAAALLMAEDEPKDKDRWLEEFIGSVIKEVVMHEVGHTLGLRHNFVASTMLELAEINKDGGPKTTVGSVMDYNGVNLATKSEQQGAYITDSIGPYDYWAIEYGYKPVDDAKELAKIAARGATKGLHYATDEDAFWGADPYVNTYDLGTDPLAYAEQRLRLADEMLPKLEGRLVAEGDGYVRLRNAVDVLMWEKLSSAMFAAKFLGGERYHRDHKGDENARPPVEIVAADRQRTALRLICDHLLGEQAFRLPPDLLAKLGASRWSHWGTWTSAPTYDALDNIAFQQAMVLWSLLDGSSMNRIADQELKVPAGQQPFTLTEMFDSLTTAVFGELANEKVQVSGIRQNLQRYYLDELIYYTLEGVWWGPQAVRGIAHEELAKLGGRLAKLDLTALDASTRAHLHESKVRVQKALDAAYQAR